MLFLVLGSRYLQIMRLISAVRRRSATSTRWVDHNKMLCDWLLIRTIVKSLWLASDHETWSVAGFWSWNVDSDWLCLHMWMGYMYNLLRLACLKSYILATLLLLLIFRTLKNGPRRWSETSPPLENSPAIAPSPSTHARSGGWSLQIWRSHRPMSLETEAGLTLCDGPRSQWFETFSVPSFFNTRNVILWCGSVCSQGYDWQIEDLPLHSSALGEIHCYVHKTLCLEARKDIMGCVLWNLTMLLCTHARTRTFCVLISACCMQNMH